MVTLDLFSGSGGLSLGALAAGLRVEVAVERDKDAAATYKANFRNISVIHEDVLNVSCDQISKIASPEAIIAGPPCQGFSTSNQRTRTDDNPLNNLLFEPLRFVKYFLPRLVIIENVSGLSIGTRRKYLDKLVFDLVELKYSVQVISLVGTDCGVPQKRNRLFVVASPHSMSTIIPEKHPVEFTVRDAIGDLPELENGNIRDVLPYRDIEPSEYAGSLRAQDGYCSGHSVTNNSPQILERYSHIPEGGNWKSIPRSLLHNYRDPTRCHTGIYHRLSWDQPGKVLGNFRKNMLIHPGQHRGLSVREAARLQSFPDIFDFCGSIGKQQQQVGNAVPPMMARRLIEAALTQKGSRL